MNDSMKARMGELSLCSPCVVFNFTRRTIVLRSVKWENSSCLDGAEGTILEATLNFNDAEAYQPYQREETLHLADFESQSMERFVVNKNKNKLSFISYG